MDPIRKIPAANLRSTPFTQNCAGAYHKLEKKELTA